MYKSLMFKTNPLAQELERFKLKQMAERKTSNPQNKKLPSKPKQKYSLQNKSLNLNSNNTHKHPHLLPKNSINHIFQSQKANSSFSTQKEIFKIHNYSFKNNNFVNRSISPQDLGQIKLTKRFSHNQKSQNSKNIQLFSDFDPKFESKEFKEYSVNQRVERNKNKKQFPSNKISDRYLSFNENKKSHQVKTMTTQNQLKSTLYQSIDLGNIFQKIESKIDLSKAIHFDDTISTKHNVSKQIQQNSLTQRNSKKVKMIEKLKSQLTSQTSKKPSEIMNQFNIKNLIEKKLQNQRYKSPKTPQPESLTSRDPFFPQPTEIDSLINSLNFNDLAQKRWMPSTRKKSSVIIIDNKGNIVEEEPLSKLKKHRQSNLKVQQQMAKLRQISKPPQMSKRI